MADATITAVAFSRLVGATKPEVDELVASGTLPQPTGRDRRLPLREAAASYLAHLRAHLATARAGAAASRAQDARADAAALTLAVERRELIDAQEVEVALDAVCGAINVALLCIPTRVTRDLSQRRLLEESIYRLRAELALDLSTASEGNTT
ncbi:hypothetical protein D1122_14865 [Cereibacter sphaeroides]|uniref:hypothetical protein n=1 Tax=Cereibacter sphaeroides TaxID=1063 RepID=UPI000E5A49B5|nr:hypothetical protein [Cereibacter sphaeroides]RHZ95362.1 hypothetical protein D1122_14865 [Cereibacter sphaeroides]